MTSIVKLKIRIPADRKDELLEIAERWCTEAGHKPPGWDAKAIHRIAGDRYGSLQSMFEQHGWPERGSDMMRQVQSRVRDRYGSVEAFVDQHRK